MLSVGIRELKTNLSKYLKRIKQGETLIITEHGKSIGRILPEGLSTVERLQGLELSGILLQAGSALQATQPVATAQGDHLISDLVSEDRDANYLS